MISLQNSLLAGAVALAAVTGFGAAAHAQYGVPQPYVVQPNVVVPQPNPGGGAQATLIVYPVTALNMRTGPGTGFPVITVIPAGAVVRAWDCRPPNGWCGVLWNGIQGWASARYLVTEAAVIRPPAPPPPYPCPCPAPPPPPPYPYPPPPPPPVIIYPGWPHVAPY